MHIAITIKEFPPDVIGGAETQTQKLAASLHGHDHDVTVFTKRYRSHDDSDVDYEIVRVPNIQFNSFLSDLTFLLVCFLYFLRRRSEFDCLQCMMIYPVGFLGLIINRLTALPYFAWIRGNDFYVAKDISWKRWMIRRVLSDTLVLVQSPEIEADVREEFPDLNPEIDVLGNGVDLPPEPWTEPDENRVLFIGRFAPKKGLEYLFDAMEEINVDCELVLVGDGDQREALERRADDLDVDVRFEGFVLPSEVDTYYRDASVFVLPSTEGEGMPNVVLEAMAWGVPVVTTDSGGLPSMIEDGQTGFLVPMRDSETLRRRIEELLNNSGQRKEMGKAARKYVRKNHSWEIQVSSLERIYHRVMYEK
jgi:glycosyltransferase involved in cell wall biosynthesis